MHTHIHTKQNNTRTCKTGTHFYETRASPHLLHAHTHTHTQIYMQGSRIPQIIITFLSPRNIFYPDSLNKVNIHKL